MTNLFAHDPMESAMVDVGTPGIDRGEDDFLYADEYVPEGAPDDPTPCEVNDCENTAIGCWCGAAHCTIHPHDEPTDVEILNEALVGAGWTDDGVEPESYEDEVNALRLALSLALERWPEVTGG